LNLTLLLTKLKIRLLLCKAATVEEENQKYN